MQDEALWYFFVVVLFLNVFVLVCLSSVNRKLNEMTELFVKALKKIKDNEDEDYDSADWWK